jgi:hypothetical protein
LSSRAVKSFVGIAAVAALAWLLWRAERQRAQAPGGTSPKSASSSTGPSKENSEDGAADASALQQATSSARTELATLTGTLKVSGEDLPLGGFLIEIEGVSTTRADPFGEFEFQGLAPGPVRLLVQASEPFEPLERKIELAPGMNTVELRLVPRFELTVIVVEQAAQPGAGTQPIPGARVRLEYAEDTEAFWDRRPRDVAGSGVTDAEGRWVLGGIPSGDFALVAESEGHVPSRVPLSCWYGDKQSRAHPRSVVVALSTSSAVLRGRVKGPDRRPQVGALVCLDQSPNRKRTFTRDVAGIMLPSPPYTFTDAEGVFELPLPKDAFEVALVVCGRDDRLSPIARRVVANEDFEREVAIQLIAARRIELRVQGNNSRGHLKVSDGELAYDLVSDPTLAAIPGFAEFFVATVGPHLDGTSGWLSLPDGGYQVSFEDGLGIAGSWFIRVGAGLPTLNELYVP